MSLCQAFFRYHTAYKIVSNTNLTKQLKKISLWHHPKTYFPLCNLCALSGVQFYGQFCTHNCMGRKSPQTSFYPTHRLSNSWCHMNKKWFAGLKWLYKRKNSPDTQSWLELLWLSDLRSVLRHFHRFLSDPQRSISKK